MSTTLYSLASSTICNMFFGSNSISITFLGRIFFVVTTIFCLSFGCHSKVSQCQIEKREDPPPKNAKISSAYPKKSENGIMEDNIGVITTTGPLFMSLKHHSEVEPQVNRKFFLTDHASKTALKAPSQDKNAFSGEYF